MKSRPWYVAVFTGDRAQDLVAVLPALAATKYEAIQQAWECIADSRAADPATLEYHVVPAPLAWRRPRG